MAARPGREGRGGCLRLYEVAGAALHLLICLADVLADDAAGKEHGSPYEPQRDEQGGPAGQRPARRPGAYAVDDAAQRGEHEEQAQAGDAAQRARGERGDAVHGQGEHLGERVLRLAGLAGQAVVVDHGRGESQRGHEAAEEEVALGEGEQGLERAAAHQAEVGVVEDQLRPHGAQQPVEGSRRGALEGGVCGAGAARAVHDVAPLPVEARHAGDGLDVVLQVSVDGDHGVGPVHRPFQAGPEGSLVAAIVGEAQAVHVGRAGGHRGYLRPGAVVAAVVHVEYEEVVHLVALAHLPQQREQPAVGLGQGLLLVVAGHHQGQRHRGALLSRGAGGLARQRMETLVSRHRLKVFAAKIRREFVGNLKTLRGEAESRRAARPRPCRGKSLARGKFPRENVGGQRFFR